MTDEEARGTVRNMLRIMGHRDRALGIVGKMSRREVSQGVVFATRLRDLVQDTETWLQGCADRMLQDEASAET